MKKQKKSDISNISDSLHGVINRLLDTQDRLERLEKWIYAVFGEERMDNWHSNNVRKEFLALQNSKKIK